YIQSLMSKPPVMVPPYAPVSSASISGGPAPSACSDTSALANPPISMAPRQREAAVTREVLEIKARLMSTEDEIGGLRSMVAELQSRDEASKHEREGLKFRLQQAEAHSNRLEAILTTYLSSQGVNLDQLQDATTMSELNLTSFNAWVDHCIQHGPTLSGIHHLSSKVLNRRVLISQCTKYYSSIKWQAISYHGEKKPVAGIKRRGEGLGVAESKQDPESEETFADFGTIDAGPVLADQLYNNTRYSHEPLLVDPAISNYPVQVAGSADFRQVVANELIEQLGAPGSSDVQVSSQDTKVQVPELDKHNSRGNIRSRRVMKLATQEKKRPLLTGDNKKYKESKYDSYFTLGAMSDEEYVETSDAKGSKVMELVSHEYEFASDEFVKCRQTIDEIPDPNETAKKLKRWRGSPRPGPPPKAKKADHGLHSWMIKPDVLIQNPHWFNDGRVYISGPKWNLQETAPGGSMTPKPKKVKLEVNPNLHAMQKTQAEWVHAKEQVQNWQGAQASGN
ncbi:hypothetical protein FRC11_007539, partial [Ceratobasidium sp. 423]